MIQKDQGVTLEALNDVYRQFVATTYDYSFNLEELERQAKQVSKMLLQLTQQGVAFYFDAKGGEYKPGRKPLGLGFLATNPESPKSE